MDNIEFNTTIYEQRIRNCKDGSKVLRIVLESNSDVHGNFTESVKFLTEIKVNEEIKINITKRV